jgi:hypothetical protein
MIGREVSDLLLSTRNRATDQYTTEMFSDSGRVGNSSLIGLRKDSP